MTSRRWRRPIRVALYIADRALRADVAEICEGAEIAVAAPPPCVAAPPPVPPPQAGEERGTAEDRGGEDADVALADRLVETDVPLIVLKSGETRGVWPPNVRAVVPTDVDAATLAAIIAVVAAGYALVPGKSMGDEETGGWANSGAEAPDAADEVAGALSPREREVLALLAEGASNKEIARALALSIHTVKFHVASLTEKLGAKSRVEAVAIAIRTGLVMV